MAASGATAIYLPGFLSLEVSTPIARLRDALHGAGWLAALERLVLPTRPAPTSGSATWSYSTA